MKSLGICFTALLLASAQALADTSRTEEFRYPLNEGGEVRLSNVNGDIRITAGSGDEVYIVATKRARNEQALDELRVVIEATPNAIRIETKHPDSRWGWNDDSGGSVSYELSVPPSSRLDGIGTVNGDIRVAGVRGKVRAKSVNGNLDLEDLADDVALETVNGAIHARFQRIGAGQRITADTVNGRIEFELPIDASAQVSAQTFNGSLKVDDFGLKVEKGFVGRDVDGEIGAGEARIEVETVNGAIGMRQL